MKRNLLLPMMLLVAGGVFGPSVKAQNWTGATIDAAKDKTVYLWNVGAKQFLGKGGLWGTEAVISPVGTPFVVKSSGTTYYLQSAVKGHGASDAGCLGFMNGVNSSHDRGNFFVDRNRGTEADATTTLYTFTNSGTGNGYQIKVTSDDGDPTYFKDDFYMVADMTNGHNKAWGVKKVNETDSLAYSQWIVVTEEERKEYFKNAEKGNEGSIPATFLMYDYGFDRKDNSVSNWQTSSASGKGLDGTLSWDENKTATPKDVVTYTYTYTGTCEYTWYNRSYTHTVTHTVTTTTPPTEQDKKLTISCGGNYLHGAKNVTVTLDESKTVAANMYYNGNGYAEGTQVTEDEDGNKLGAAIHQQKLYGGDWTANIHGSYGVVNQTIKNENMVRKGWYRVSCVGFTTATQGTAQLYASVGTADTEGKYYAVKNLKAISEDDQPATYAKASKLINSPGSGYEASVMVYVDEKATNVLKTLSFGVMVNGAQDNAWTCFDSFQIDYLGNPETNLVLDEDQTSVDYIKAQVDNSELAEESKTRTLYLHRTVNAGKWNSIVLPVNLTVGQVKDAFGGVHISEFKGAINENIPGRMYFESVNVDRTNNNAIAIKAGHLYIIKPSESEPTDQEPIEFPEATKITDKLTSYFTIQQVTFDAKADDINAKVEGEKGDETYQSDTKVQFVGTYVANKEGDNLIPANSYVLRGNKDGETGLWFYRTKTTSTKGFRGWLQTVESTNTSKISFSINGVVDDSETTGIDAIGAELNAHAVNGNIYNLSGQLVRRNATSLEGLAKGVYIHNGKKYIVK